MSISQQILFSSGGVEESLTIELSTTSFTDGQAIPGDHKNNVGGQCSGSNNSPQLTWTVTGSITQVTSLRLECWDIDGGSGSSRSGHFRHWFVTTISASPGTYSLAENANWGSGNPTGAPATSDFGTGDRANGWGGPCPPSGTHNYRIEVYPINSNGDTITTNVTNNILTFTST